MATRTNSTSAAFCSGTSSLETFELAGHDESDGYRLQILDDSQSNPFAVLGKLVQKIVHALSMKHLHYGR